VFYRIDGPIIECDSTSADINQFNVYLRCLVRARPSATSLFWIADVNGTTVSDDDVTSDYWSTVTVCLSFLLQAFPAEYLVRQGHPYSIAVLLIVLALLETVKVKL